tara:strand:- start:476 stop:1351 length:876 start_codon:yes stop_codon:yes gene_type:complete
MAEEETVENEPVDSNEPSSLLGGREEVESEAEVNTEWKEGLSEEYKATFDRFKDLNSVAKSYGELRKELGDRIKIPTDDSTDEERAEFYKKMGRPDSWEGYEYKPSDGMPSDINWDKDKTSKMLKTAHDIGLSKDQAIKYMKRMEAEAVEGYENVKVNRERDRSQEMEKARASIKDEYGGAYMNVLSNANWALKEFADENTARFIQDSAGNNTGVLKMFHKIAEMTRPKESLERSGSGTSSMDSTVMDEIKAIRTDTSHKFHKAYKDRNDPGHKEAHAYVNKLYAQVHPDE